MAKPKLSKLYIDEHLAPLSTARSFGESLAVAILEAARDSLREGEEVAEITFPAEVQVTPVERKAAEGCVRVCVGWGKARVCGNIHGSGSWNTEPKLDPGLRR